MQPEPLLFLYIPANTGDCSHPSADRSVSIEDFKNYKVSSRCYINRRIGDFLKKLPLTAGCNTGFRKIINALKHNGSPLPVFETDEKRLSFAVTIYRHPEFTDSGVINGVINHHL
jgi:ATP-dependent DNA helicase RecG